MFAGILCDSFVNGCAEASESDDRGQDVSGCKEISKCAPCRGRECPTKRSDVLVAKDSLSPEALFKASQK